MSNVRRYEVQVANFFHLDSFYWPSIDGW